MGLGIKHFVNIVTKCVYSQSLPSPCEVTGTPKGFVGECNVLTKSIVPNNVWHTDQNFEKVQRHTNYLYLALLRELTVTTIKIWSDFEYDSLENCKKVGPKPSAAYNS